MASPPARYPARRPAASPKPPANLPPGVAARRAALRLLDAVLRRGDPLELALHGATQGLPDRADRALVHMIVAGTLRHMVALDELIDSATRDRLPDDAKARMVLRIALVQLLVLGTPDHAVVATALPLVDGGPRKLVHGVLGTLIRSGVRLPEHPALPPEVAMRWAKAWGEDALPGLAQALAARAPVDLTLADATQTAALAESMGGVSLAPGHVRLPTDTGIVGLEGYAEGGWWVQDLAASIPARIAGAGNGRTAIDLCAAPGGKTLQLAGAGWRVTALDRSAKRLERLTENLNRARLEAQVVTADALEWSPSAPADLVLLDAPCSATGIFRRHPDVLYRVGQRQISEMTELQAKLLDRAGEMVTKGGLLIYATCSLEPAEGEEQIAAFLARDPRFAPLPIEVQALPPGISASGEGTVRTLPTQLAEHGRIDGFFIACLRRVT